MSSAAACESTVLFPVNLTDTSWATAPLDTGGAVAVQALPLVYTLLLWIFLEARPAARRGATRSAQLQGDALGVLAAAAQGLLAWRVFDLLDRAGVASAESWRMTAVLAAPATAVALVFAAGWRLPRLSVLDTLGSRRHPLRRLGPATAPSPSPGRPRRRDAAAGGAAGVVPRGRRPSRGCPVATDGAPRCRASRLPRRRAEAAAARHVRRPAPAWWWTRSRAAAPRRRATRATPTSARIGTRPRGGARGCADERRAPPPFRPREKWCATTSSDAICATSNPCSFHRSRTTYGSSEVTLSGCSRRCTPRRNKKVKPISRTTDRVVTESPSCCGNV